MVGGTVNGRIRRGVTTTNSARPPLPEAVLASSASDLSLNGSRPVGMASRNLAVASETDLHSPESAVKKEKNIKRYSLSILTPNYPF